MPKGSGRHTSYKPEYCDKVTDFFKQGLSKIEIAAELGVNRTTLDRWAEKFPEFARIVNEDIDFSEAWWTKQGRLNLANKDFNSRLYEINMMNRFGWMKKAQDKHDVSIKHENYLKELA